MGIWFEVALLIILAFDAWQKREIISLQKMGNRSRDKPAGKKKTAGSNDSDMHDDAWRKHWRGEGDDD